MYCWWHRYKSWRTRKTYLSRAWPETVRRHVEAATRIAYAQPLSQARLVIFDTEMTGLGPEDRLLALGAIRYKDGRLDLGDSFHEIVDPERIISPASILVHHIVPQAADGRPAARQVLPRFLEYVGADLLVAHNARYDRELLDREMLRHFDLPLITPIIDLWLLSRATSELLTRYQRPGVREDHTLDGLAMSYGLSLEDRHSAYGDALVAGLIFLRLLKELRAFGVAKIGDLLRLAHI